MGIGPALGLVLRTPVTDNSSLPSPVCVMPVSRMDWHLAFKWLKWASKISNLHDIPFIVLHAENLEPGHIAALGAAGAREFRVARGIREEGFFIPANMMFKAALDLMEKEFPGSPLLWIEADTVPMDEHWYGNIAAEYAACGKPFLGDLCIQGQSIPHMTGNAVYHPGWRKFAPSLAQGPGFDMKWGWDSQCAKETFPCAAQSKTIRQVWRPEPFELETYQQVVPFGTALFHQCKDGTLIDVLCKEKHLDMIPMPDPVQHSGYQREVALASVGNGTGPGATEILIVTCRRDIAFLRYCLLSIEKYARGFAGVTIVVPEDEKALFADFALSGRNIKVKYFKEDKLRGMLHHEVQICRADEWCPAAQAILHVDADCMFWKNVTPSDYAVGGAPIIVRERYEECGKRNTNRLFWRTAVEQAVGFTPVYETMVRHPNIYLRSLYPKVRALVEKHTGKGFDEYVLGCHAAFPHGFAEFPTLGAVALKFFAGDYYAHDYDQLRDSVECGVGHRSFQYIYRRDRDKLCEFWSHGGIARYEGDCINFLNGQIPAYVVK